MSIADGPGVQESRPVSGSERAALVEAAAKVLRASYVYPKVGEAMAADMEARLKAGGYDAVGDERALAARLTADCRAISHDRHLAVRLGAKEEGSEGPEVGPPHAVMEAENYAFKKVEVLPGNIGYLRFDMFIPTEEAKATGAAAMAFLAHCDAVIVDLRQNGGGSPEMIQFLTSYLFDEPVHLNDMVDREGKVVEEFWTLKDVPGQRFRKGLPVFVLTSSRTFSGAEEFTYNLKNLERATIVGETTGGGAHPVRPTGKERAWSRTSRRPRARRWRRRRRSPARRSSAGAGSVDRGVIRGVWRCYGQPLKNATTKSKKSWLSVAPEWLKSASPEKNEPRKSKKSWELSPSTWFQSAGQGAPW
jgi:hypothetical protein